MKKFAVLALALMLSLSFVAAFAEETYLCNSVYAEAGYEGDCYNGVAKILTLNDDGTFKLVDNTSIIQAQYNVVTNWFYIVTGTYEVTDDEEGTKTVALHGADVTYVMNGSITTSAEDAELLEDYAEMTAECDGDSLALTLE